MTHTQQSRDKLYELWESLVDEVKGALANAKKKIKVVGFTGGVGKSFLIRWIHMFYRKEPEEDQPPYWPHYYVLEFENEIIVCIEITRTMSEEPWAILLDVCDVIIYVQNGTIQQNQVVKHVSESLLSRPFKHPSSVKPSLIIVFNMLTDDSGDVENAKEKLKNEIIRQEKEFTSQYLRNDDILLFERWFDKFQIKVMPDTGREEATEELLDHWVQDFMKSVSSHRSRFETKKSWLKALKAFTVPPIHRVLEHIDKPLKGLPKPLNERYLPHVAALYLINEPEWREFIGDDTELSNIEEKIDKRIQFMKDNYSPRHLLLLRKFVLGLALNSSSNQSRIFSATKFDHPHCALCYSADEELTCSHKVCASCLSKLEKLAGLLVHPKPIYVNFFIASLPLDLERHELEKCPECLISEYFEGLHGEKVWRDYCSFFVLPEDVTNYLLHGKEKPTNDKLTDSTN